MKISPGWLPLLAAAGLAVLFVASSVRPAFAHGRVEVGPYVLIIGWEVEPVIVGERNALVLEVTRDDTPVEGVEGTLNFVVVYAGRTYTANLSPTAVPGHYRADIFPTVKGQYEVHLSGKIEDLTLDEIIEPEEVLNSSVVTFPEAIPEPRDLQAQIEALESRLGTANALAAGGIVLGLAGLVLSVVALRRQK